LADELDLPKSVRQPLQELLQSASHSRELEDILPLFYTEPHKQESSLLLDHLENRPQIIYINRYSIRQRQEALEKILEERLHQVRLEQAGFFTPQLFVDAKLLQQRLNTLPTVFFEELGDDLPTLRHELTLQTQTIRKEEKKFMVERLRRYLGEGFRVFIACDHQSQLSRLREIFRGLLNDREFSALYLGSGELQHGFLHQEEKILFIPDREIFDIQKRRRRSHLPSRSQQAIAEANQPVDLTQFQEGSYVVHIDHGIGLYRGLEHLKVGGQESDFVRLEYYGGDLLYLPIYRLNLIQPYMAASQADGERPSIALDKLGSPAWNQRKEKVRKAIQEMTQELLKLYASRKIIEGFAFGARDTEFREFEAAFPFQETRDQARAIEEVLADMETPRPMDRLICGDVGFGKTEVALRAAFRAVLDKKQVAIVVPTTLLAEQHLQTFKQRSEQFGVKVESLSRFKSRQELKETLRKVASGEVDIVIGTHRLLSSDVVFKDLGLLVIDEEHRFGVAHKEKLKRYRAKIDVITMTATPIPRTLQLS
jgi:transcription-repair coupling factor (superfamily II helicase)